ncbi:hypothetical protein LLEC1_01391 [Akanthomyces lecanii]|uniref:Macro-like domain-containing protein n=1 Tax=Cordyceps confragosa TaxID=2714763 RepID=A0A179I4M3_CORDF|nr:hypothetical protein LLEC1_01391 [Akanthomyces lecanii]
MPQPANLTIHLLCMLDKDRDAYLRAAALASPPSFADITIHRNFLSRLPSSVRVDAIVSPANSYGRLDGAFDDAISRALSPTDDYLALTRAAQAVLYKQYRGWAIPGSCTPVPIPAAFAARSKNVWGVRHVLLCPTMRVPEDVTWDKDVVYQCVWSMLCAVEKHNETAAAGDRIEAILMTPLATGVGRVSEHVWAAQLLLALRHYSLAVENPDEFAALDVDRILTLDGEIKETYKTNPHSDKP